MKDTVLTMKPRKIHCRSRNVKISDNFYKSIAVPIRLCQFSGCGPFLYSRKGIRKSILAYIVFVLQIILYVAGITYVTVNKNGKSERWAYGTHTAIISQVSVFSLLIIWILGLFNIGKWSKLLKDIVAIDQALAKFDIWVDYSKCVKKIYWVLTALLIQFSPLFLYGHYQHDSLLVLLLIIYLPNWNNIIVAYTVSIMVYLIHERLELINSMLQRIVEQNLDGISFLENKKEEKPLKILCHVCSWHHNIVKHMALTTEAFGLKTVVFFGYAFIVIVMGMFLLCRLFKGEICWLSLMENVFSVGSYMFTVYKVCNICEYTVREAKRSGLLIHQIETEDFDMRDEIEMFSLQLANENIEFSAAGFFPIDYSLLFSIIGGVTTYIIILIQLDSSEPESIGGDNTTSITSLATFSYGSTSD